MTPRRAGKAATLDAVTRLQRRSVFPDTPCWNWAGARNSAGYGTFSLQGTNVLVHRFSYETFRGAIPKDETVDHTCSNKVCWNPAHLTLLTREENSAKHYAAITHCPEGHAYTPENTHLNGKGTRSCKTCKAQRRKAAA